MPILSFFQLNDDHEAYRNPGDKFVSLVQLAKEVDSMDSESLLQLVEPKIMTSFSCWDLVVRRFVHVTMVLFS